MANLKNVASYEIFVPRKRLQLLYFGIYKRVANYEATLRGL